MKRSLVFFLMAVLLLSLPALAQDSFKDVEYITGKEGFEKKMKGVLELDDAEIRFTDNKGRAVFTMPLATVTKVEASSEREEGSFGRKLALGIFASKNQEYLYIDTKTEETAEVLVFKCKKKTSGGIAAKINFRLEKLNGTDG